MTEKHNSRKAEIIQQAFQVWGADQFRDTSLSSLALEMGVTKQAFYRYFKNKDMLLNAMADYIEEIVNESNKEVLSLLERNEDRDLILEKVITSNYRFLNENALFLNFMGFMYRKMVDRAQGIMDINIRVFNLISEKLHIPMAAIHYCNSLIYLSLFNPDEKVGLEQVLSLFKSGFASSSFKNSISWEKCELLCSDNDFSPLYEDKVLIAIFEALAEEGDIRTSLKKVAEKAGMKKSSLYNYYSNKDEMLTQALFNAFNLYLLIHKSFMDKIPGFADKMMGHVVYLFDFFSRFPEFIKILERLLSEGHFRQDNLKEKHMPNIDFIDTVNQGFDQGFIDERILSPKEFWQFINISHILQIRYLLFLNEGEAEMKRQSQDLYTLIYFGIEGWRKLQ